MMIVGVGEKKRECGIKTKEFETFYLIWRHLLKNAQISKKRYKEEHKKALRTHTYTEVIIPVNEIL